jgi:hypothetical protein
MPRKEITVAREVKCKPKRWAGGGSPRNYHLKKERMATDGIIMSKQMKGSTRV